MRKLGPADYVLMPWKNGGGSTTQLAISPPGAGLDDFDWRISTAQVAASGPFSIFPGIDRSLAILRGDGLSLQPDEQDAVLLTPDSEPFAFAGEQRIDATLISGPIADFNVMTRRASWRHSLQVVRINGTQRFARQSDLLFVYCMQGELQVRNDGEEARCTAGDAVMIDHGDAVELTSNSARICIARLTLKGTPDDE